GPVFLAYRDQAAVDRIANETMKSAPLYDFTAPDGIKNTIWRVQNPDQLTALFAKIPKAYIADGHHRAASGSRVAHDRRAANPAHTGAEEYNWFMAVLFPAKQLQILPYNRCVVDLNGMSPDLFLEKLRILFQVTVDANPKPSQPRNVSMYLGGRWYGLNWPAPLAADPVSSLDVSVLQDRVLHPLLGIDDPRTSKRIEFVGGIRGTQELEKRVKSGRSAVAFSMFPTTVDQLMAIADAGQIMPPKSTWFEPKLKSGLLVHSLDG
ncbi:MAG: DUF1015 family protein, partial [Lentisphaerota bacterium]